MINQVQSVVSGEIQEAKSYTVHPSSERVFTVNTNDLSTKSQLSKEQVRSLGIEAYEKWRGICDTLSKKTKAQPQQKSNTEKVEGFIKI